RVAAEAAPAPVRLLPAACQARQQPRAARPGRPLPPGQRRGARAAELDGRLVRAGDLALGGDDGELRVLAGRGRAQPGPLFPRAPHRRFEQRDAARPRGAALSKAMSEQAASHGRLAENVMHFSRLLRAAGLRIGPDRVLDCVRALQITGAAQFPPRREDWYWTMSAVLLSREEQRPVFDQAFDIFLRDPNLTEK